MTLSNRELKQIKLTAEIRKLKKLARKTFFTNMFNRLVNDTTFSNGANQLTYLCVKSDLLILQFESHSYFNEQY